MPKHKDYNVGFCKPPRHSRFKPGQCGNPRGRPRRSRNIDTIMREALYQTVQITRAGKKVRVPAFFQRSGQRARRRHPAAAA